MMTVEQINLLTNSRRTGMKPDHCTFLLRIWKQFSLKGNPAWRISLQCPKTGETVSFKSIVELAEYLEEITTGDQNNTPVEIEQ